MGGAAMVRYCNSGGKMPQKDCAVPSVDINVSQKKAKEKKIGGKER